MGDIGNELPPADGRCQPDDPLPGNLAGPFNKAVMQYGDFVSPDSPLRGFAPPAPLIAADAVTALFVATSAVS